MMRTSILVASAAGASLLVSACQTASSRRAPSAPGPAQGAVDHQNPNCKATSNAGGQGTWTWTSTAVATGTKPTGGTGNSPANGTPGAGSTTPPATTALALNGTATVAVTWSDVKAVLQNNCIGACHTHDAYLTYATASAQAPEMVQRTDLVPSDANFMPQGGQKLDLAAREKLIQWVGEGMPNDAGSTGTATSTGTDSGKARFTTPVSTATPGQTGC